MNEKIVGIQKWLGVNQAGTDDTSLKLGEASEMRNWRVTQDGALRKRPGMKAVHTFPGEIQGTWCGYVGGEYVQVAAAGGKLWKIGFPSTTAVSALGTLADAHTEFFGFREKLYILNGTQYKVFDGHTLADVTGYVPTVLVGVGADGSGTELEQINKLSSKRKYRIATDGTSTVYVCPESGTLSVSVKNRATGATLVAGTDYTFSDGKITFTSAPPAGADVYEVEYTVASDDSGTVKAMKFAELYNGATDNRVFLYGDGSNKALYSGLDIDGNPTAEYFPDMNVLDIGDENTPITAMIRHYSRLLAFKEDSAYSVQYGTVTNAEGKILPAFYWTQVNKAIGNIAPGQVRLVDNSPYTLFGESVYTWKNNSSYSSNLTIDERQAKRISDRVWKTLQSFDLRQSYCWDDNDRKEWYCVYGDTAIVHNYGLNVWYLYTNFPVKHFYRSYGRLLGARENVLVEISDAFRNDCGEAIDARWESGNMHFGADFMRKYSAMLWIGLVPTHAGSMTVTVMTDRKADFSKKLVFRNSAAFDHANFAHWSFNTNKRPYMTRLKLKAKKFTYYKLILTNDDADTTATVTSADVRVRFTGYVR